VAVKIAKVEKRSACFRKGMRNGDCLVAINGNPINDVLDYRFYATDDILKITYRNAKGKEKNRKIRSNGDVDSIGLSFDTYLMDRHHACKNKCIFCFVDQMPKGMRSSLYFKDDDSRLSFLFGNYITLTGLSESEVERIIKMHISPINVSVHTMNPELRVQMMKNPHAGTSLQLLKRFADAGIRLNTQLVLCPWINDGEELSFSLQALADLGEYVQSIAAVPVGLTKHREGLYNLTAYTKETADDVLRRIDAFNNSLMQNGRQRLAFAADEFYLAADRELPDVSYYGDFCQLDNGVGMLTLLQSDFSDLLAQASEVEGEEKVIGLATGVAAYPYICKLARMFMQKFPHVTIRVQKIVNHFFGESVTVAGLITGKDLIDGLRDRISDENCILIPDVMLRSKDDPVFLDDLTVEDISAAVGLEIIPVGCGGADLFDALYSMIGG